MLYDLFLKEKSIHFFLFQPILQLPYLIKINIFLRNPLLFPNNPLQLIRMHLRLQIRIFFHNHINFFLQILKLLFPSLFLIHFILIFFLRIQQFILICQSSNRIFHLINYLLIMLTLFRQNL